MRRRDALKTIGGLAGAAAMARFLPACGGGSDAPQGITTYVFMMMENRSYDHVFGARSMIENLPGDGPAMGTSLPGLTGTPAVALYNPAHGMECDQDPPHDWDPMHASFNNGANDGFVQQYQMDYANGTAPMQYLTRDEMPVSYALADAYTSCDRWFCSVMGPTWPNRFYWHTGQSEGLMTNEIPTGGINFPTIYNRLNDAKVEWAYYYGSIPVVAVVQGLDVMGPHGSRIKNFSQFLVDAAAGTLPPVVYIDPAFYENDDHPPIHPINGQELIATVYKALAQSPQWNNIHFTLTYDESGGFYDHVAPPSGVPDDYAATGFDQLGFRVPALVIGPYAKQGVNSTVRNHASALAHIQNVFKLENLTMRTAAATDLSDTIDMDRLMKNDPAPPIDLPLVDLTQWPVADAACVYNGSTVGGNEPPTGTDPISAWADANPDMVKGLDLRPNIREYRQAIRDFLLHDILPGESRKA